MQERHVTRLRYTALLFQGNRYVFVCAVFVAVLTANSAFATPDSTLRLSADFPYFGAQKKLMQDIYVNSPEALKGTLTFNCFKYRAKEGDSIFVYGQKDVPVKISQGTAAYHFKFGPNGAGSFVHAAFYDILRRTGTVPAGNYRLYLTVRSDSGAIFQKVISLQADSALPATSPLSRQISSKLVPESKKGLLARLGGTAATLSSKVPAAKSIENHGAVIGRLLKARGLSPQTEQRNGKTYVNLWYEDWFVGRYELEGSQAVGPQLEKRKAQVAGNVSSLASNELESYRSLFSQVRELAKANKKESELSGELALSGNWSNGQPEYSAQDDNYYEVRGRAETELADIPVSIEGYYTTQDAHRQIKGSYFRFHYDADRAKEKLMKLISGYRGQFSQTVAKGKGLEQVYGSYLSSLQSSKSSLLIDLKREAGLSAYGKGAGRELDTSGLRKEIEAALAQKMSDTAALLSAAKSKEGNSLDSAGKLKAAQQKAEAAAQQAALIKDSAARLYDRAMTKYGELQKLQARIEKYQSLLEQYRNTAYFDSALAYSKVKDLKGADQTTYKQMAKSAAGLLPEGKAKTFIAGLTHLDAGIINKYSSKYTAAGQQLTGLDLGYDIGFAQVGASVGKTEYAGRDGSLDKYTTYSGSLTMVPAKGQKTSLIYYGYTPSKSMLQDNGFFQHADIALPSFRKPVHIVSATYEGTIASLVTVEAEAATSFQNGTSRDFKTGFDADRIAWHLNAESAIPKTPFSLAGSYEHGGKNFQNSTLPVMVSGSDLYKAGVKGEFFHGFLTAGLEFNHMQQENLYATGGNNRWGFEVATHSKQYPSVSLSYKPFATFRSFADTLAVPQRPLQGAVWTGKASYQIKRPGGVCYRFSAVLNRSSSHTDSVGYNSDLVQLNAIYTDREWMLMGSAGQSRMSIGQDGLSTDSLNPAHVKTTFFAGSAGYSFSKGWSLSGGADIGFAPFGLSKWGLNAGLNYRLSTLPLTLRANGRFGAYRLEGYSGPIGSDLNVTDGSTSPMQWRRLVSGTLELIWQFRMKLNE